MNPIPNYAEDLIKELAVHYPQRCISANERLEDAHRYAGAADLVAALVARLEFTRTAARPKEVLNVRR